MMNHFVRRSLILSATLALAACGTPARYYLLSADGPATATAEGAGTVGLGPVRIPDYIDRPELVFQSAPNRFEVPGGHRWAGALEPTITRVLAAGLDARLPGRAVQPYPWDPGVPPRLSVAVTIAQFHSLSGGDAVLEASWRVLDSSTSTAVATRSVTLTEPLADGGYDGVVAAQSRLLAKLAAHIAPTVPGD